MRCGIICGVVVLLEKGSHHGMDAECMVKERYKFVRCSEAGVSIVSFNDLDWWVWDSEFVRSAVGATNAPKNEYGGGHFHIYRSVFRGSEETDVLIGHTSYFGMRLNNSIGSNRFIEGKYHSSSEKWDYCP